MLCVRNEKMNNASGVRLRFSVMKRLGHLSVVLAILVVPLPLSAAIPAAERNALIDLYNSTNGPGWTYKTNWLGAAGTECSWDGVTCDAAQNYVQDLKLGDNQLTSLAGDRSYTRAHFLYHAGVVTPGMYR